MIPHILQLKNFLSYGSELQTIDFQPYHLIYLSGRNGHGKSALLDAMTWAIWGNARKVTNAVRADQGLIRLGQTQMVVIFDFKVNGQLYRVKREYLITHGKPLAQLEFGLLNAQNNEFIPLTDKTIRATQAKIEETIKLDYESFVNTAFLRQGNANEFSKKSPKDRKEILSTILGLQEFDKLKKRALEKIKELQARRQAMNTLQDSLEKQLAQKEEVHIALEGMDTKLAACAKKEQAFNEQKQAIEKEQKEYAAEQKKAELIQFKQQQLVQKQKEDNDALMRIVTQWRSVHKKMRITPDFGEIEKKQQEIQRMIVEQEKKLQEQLKLQQERLVHHEVLQQRKAELEKESLAKQQAIQLRIEQLEFEKKNGAKQLHEQQEAIKLFQKEHAEKKEAIERLRKKMLPDEQYIQLMAQFEKRKEAYHSFVAQKNMLQSQKEGLIGKQGMVSDEDPSCPLCEQNLSAARKKFLRNKCQKEEKFITHQHTRLMRVLTALKELLVSQHATIIEQNKYKEHYTSLTKELNEKEKEIEKLTQQEQELSKQLIIVEKKLSEQQKEKEVHLKVHAELFKKDEKYVQYEKALNDVEKQLKAINYDQTLHQKMRAELEQIEKEKVAHFAMQQEATKQQERKEQISECIAHLKKVKKEVAQLTDEAKRFDKLPTIIKELDQKQQAYEQQLKQFLSERESLREQHGALKNKRDHLQAVEKENKAQQEQTKQVDLEIADYQEIALAAGKDGIQALLIEDAIPEIEQEANNLLAKLTNNQAQIFIESLRDLKRGGTKETLDINISDATGIRPYELFSGGEAFRIDFALRIAISKLLARRVGTSLQTLIIDEGFGSQDEEGLSLIMDAIYKIQDDFEKMIVVSHLPSMRDQFPVHFTVEKGPSGSHVQIMQQG